MDFAQAVKTCFNKYATFSGRARRAEYWYFVLMLFLAGLVFGIIEAVLGDIGEVLYLVWLLAILVPSFAVSARRLHDIDKSGWWMLINLIPFIGPIVFVVWTSTKGTLGPNRFGPDPLV